MPQSYVKIWIHAIWSTKEKAPYIVPAIENKVIHFLKEQFLFTGCRVSIINVVPDHVHCLFLLNKQKSISAVLKQVKGSSSHFINEQKMLPVQFGWQDGYAAYSVSEHAASRVFKYIKNQKQHHANKSFDAEYDMFLKLYGFNPKGK